MSTELVGIDDTADDKPARQWGRTQRTRRQILDAARDVFVEEGYNDANIAHIVERSGLSVGSVYHHFNGKADLFLALWDEYETLYRDAAAQAVAAARVDGERDPIELFVVGSRAYLEVARADPTLTRLFRGGDGPPGFDDLGRGVGAEWMRNNATLLGLPDTNRNRLRVRVLIAIIVEGERTIARQEPDANVDELIAEVLGIIRRAAAWED